MPGRMQHNEMRMHNDKITKSSRRNTTAAIVEASTQI
jgi:hypothetical protein